MPPRDLFIIAQVYRCCQYIILGDGRYKGAAPKRPDRRGQIAAMRQLCCRSCVSCRSKVILRRYKGSSKSKDREAPPQTALREGAELNSPSNMFLGLLLRSKSVLRNSGRICFATAHDETSLPLLIHHQNREILMINAYGNFPVSVPRPGGAARFQRNRALRRKSRYSRGLKKRC